MRRSRVSPIPDVLTLLPVPLAAIHIRPASLANAFPRLIPTLLRPDAAKESGVI